MLPKKLEVTLQVVWDDYFRRLTVENLIKNIVKENNVLKFLSFRDLRVNLFVNLPVTSPTNSVSNLKSLTISIRIEMVLFIYESVMKTLNDLGDSDPELARLRDLCPDKRSQKPEQDIERKQFLKNVRNLALLKQKYGTIRDLDEQSKFKELNLKLSANFVQLRVFCEALPQAPDQSMTDPSGKSKMPGNVGPEPPRQSDTGSNQGIQLLVESVAFNLGLKRLRVGSPDAHQKPDQGNDRGGPDLLLAAEQHPKLL